jgi:hypothetical protein
MEFADPIKTPQFAPLSRAYVQGRLLSVSYYVRRVLGRAWGGAGVPSGHSAQKRAIFPQCAKGLSEGAGGILYC